MPTLALFGPIGTTELIVLAIFGVLIFGKRLPEVGKSIGKGIVEFKKGLSGVDDDTDSPITSSSVHSQPTRPPQQLEAQSTQTTPPPAEQSAEPVTTGTSSA